MAFKISELERSLLSRKQEIETGSLNRGRYSADGRNIEEKVGK
ncbi:hypothetical protein [Okeania sp. SIO3I5]|nr:hypothetical protein [Okeania sp. SIO3I5]